MRRCVSLYMSAGFEKIMSSLIPACNPFLLAFTLRRSLPTLTWFLFSNYDKYANLGGWAVEISQKHRNWQEGREYLAPDMIQKFNQLSEMGFTFDIFPVKRGCVSAEDDPCNIVRLLLNAVYLPRVDFPRVLS